MSTKQEREEVNLVKGFRLLNSGKVAEALDKLGENPTEEALLAEYDKLGGAVRTSDGRKVVMGAFYDFKNKVARVGVKYDALGENDFEDQLVLVPKKKEKQDRKPESIKEVLNKMRNVKDEDVEEKVEAPKEVKPKAKKAKE